jgi:hypothetical protein
LTGLAPPSAFHDIADSPFRVAIEWIADQGITDGCAANLYCPSRSVSRAQMASFLARALDLPPSRTDFFADDDGSPHEPDINRAAAAGVTGGCGTARYCPNAPVNRAQMASFLVRAFELSQTNPDFFVDDRSSIHEGDINRLAASGITGGCGPSRFCPSSPVTRAQMAAFLHRALTR